MKTGLRRDAGISCLSRFVVEVVGFFKALSGNTSWGITFSSLDELGVEMVDGLSCVHSTLTPFVKSLVLHPEVIRVLIAISVQNARFIGSPFCIR
jgi:hypothetical protein